ncbi:MAG: shikimate dehydrogenase [Gammaproteobacteria bacterium]|nr:shikimate dehydrogenase [Gammaproteobacteria bacterium]
MKDLYAVMGNPVTHSQSPFIHTQFAKQTGQSLRYLKIEVPLHGFQVALQEFIVRGGKGLNITAPLKQQAFTAMTQNTKSATIAHAVNTISLQTKGELFGDNTDGIGLLRDLTINHRYSIANKAVLILGGGGAVRGILFPLLSEKPKLLMLANRTLEKAIAIRDEFHDIGKIEVSRLDDIEGSFDLIINCMNLADETLDLKLPLTIYTKSTFCYDLMYGQSVTPFLKWAVSNGIAHLANGIGMLVEQAAESFYIWRGIKPNTGPIIEMLKEYSYQS